MTINPIKIGYDWDDVFHPWYRGAHASVVASGHIPADTPMPEVWAMNEAYRLKPEVFFEVLDDEVRKGHDGMYGTALDETDKWQVHRAHDAGFENHVVTARGSFGTLGHLVKDITREQIEREGLPIDSLHFGHDKPAIINALGLDYFLDDGVHNYEAIAKYCPNTEVYLMDQPWNRYFAVPPARRLRSVEEYVDIILNKHAATVSV